MTRLAGVSVPVGRSGFENPLRSAAKLPYREAVRDYSPGLPGLGFCHKELALKASEQPFPQLELRGHTKQGMRRSYDLIAVFPAELH